MAQAPDTDSPKRKRKGASVVVWLLMAMLVTGLGGFGITNYGGGATAIGTVGARDISVTQYARALQSEVNAFSAQMGTQIPLQDALNIGLDQQVRQKLVTTTALDGEADRVGLSVGDARVAEEITANTAFRGASGTFDRETYRFTLRNNNLTEAEFEGALRDDLSRALLQGVVSGGFAGEGTLTDTLYTHIAERRGFSLLQLTEADLTQPLPAATEADLQAHYEANVAAFTRPEAKRITYAALLPEKLASTMPVDDAELKKLYETHRDDLVRPERRLVERLVFGTEDEAKAAKARLDAGEAFEKIVEERGLKLLDIDLGDVSKPELGAAGIVRHAIVIVGGGTSGWMTAATLSKALSDRYTITLVESDEIGILGVGEGTFPIIRKTMSRIGLDESTLIREADATFKQGIRFNNWKKNPADDPHDTYFHPFQVASQHTDMDLLPYWLLGVAGDIPWAEACTVQERVVEWQGKGMPRQWSSNGKRS